MSVRQAYISAGWLHSLLAGHKSRITGFLNEAISLGIPGMMKPGKFRRFLELLAQIASAQDEEQRILARIEEIESMHRANRVSEQLEFANPAYEPKLHVAGEMQENESHRKGLWRVFDFWMKPLTADNSN